MPRLLKFRPLCDSCERAEAVVWCGGEGAALCGVCDAKLHGASGAPRHERVPIGASSVVSALCARCASAPAGTLFPDLALALCELCARSGVPARRPPPGAVPLRDSPVAGSIVLDRMDFSGVSQPLVVCRAALPAGGRGGGATTHSTKAPAAGRRAPQPDHAPGKMSRSMGANGAANSRAEGTPHLDLSYFKTTVPPSVARSGPKKGSRTVVRGNDDSLARVSGGRAAKASSGGRKEKK